MQIRDLGLEGVKEIIPKRFGDARGFFSETYNQKQFEAENLPTNWVQDNHSLSADAYVLRGLHFQTNPMAQDKLVRVISGQVFDVAVDIRKNSPDYGKWVGLKLCAEQGNQILVPKGYAHGFLTLTPNAQVVYKVTALYAPENDRSIAWNDSEVGIEWPLDGQVPQLSEKDASAPKLSEIDNNFIYLKS
ncbi:dTDP-4-dehydrorhamnose 3,5-epimerase [Hirschia litorea]|uniref:dTDP-4-dehydrorhamnose 3,5-epimerase n=1 Tax=Hirschia litorea TaxID=1199156 RepID=A0ABW2IQ29_9PROT